MVYYRILGQLHFLQDQLLERILFFKEMRHSWACGNIFTRRSVFKHLKAVLNKNVVTLYSLMVFLMTIWKNFISFFIFFISYFKYNSFYFKSNIYGLLIYFSFRQFVGKYKELINIVFQKESVNSIKVNSFFLV